MCVCVCSVYRVLEMEPLPPLVACSLQPMCAMGRCRNAQFQEGEPRRTNVRAAQGQTGNVKGAGSMVGTVHLGQLSAMRRRGEEDFIQRSGEVTWLSEEGELRKWLSHPCCHAVS